MQHLQLTTQEVGGHAVLRLKGELDIATVDDLRDDLRKARQFYGERIILDLTELEFMDSQGLSVIVTCHKAVTAAGGSLGLVAPRPIVRRTLEITGLTGRLDVYETVAEATAPRTPASSEVTP
ncbi:MAG TPA: STAS domain-containing protein [Streptosporangiaceae bacterium]